MKKPRFEETAIGLDLDCGGDLYLERVGRPGEEFYVCGTLSNLSGNSVQ